MNEELMLKIKGLINLIGNNSYLAYTKEIQQDHIILEILGKLELFKNHITKA